MKIISFILTIILISFSAQGAEMSGYADNFYKSDKVTCRDDGSPAHRGKDLLDDIGRILANPTTDLN